jgi:hypothetical protein
MSSFPRRNASAVLRDVFTRERGKRSRAEERKKKHFFFAAAPLVVRSLKKKPHRLSAFACEESDDEKRKARDGQRRRASRRTRVFFTRIRAFARKIARFAEKAAIRGGGRRHPPRSASSSAEARRWSSSRRASDRARVHAKDAFDAETHPLRRLFWNKSSSPTEVSKRAGLIAFVPHRGVSSFRRLSRTGAPVGQKWKIDAFANVAFERHLRWIRGEGARGDERAASPPSPLPARAPPPPPCGRK